MAVASEIKEKTEPPPSMEPSSSSSSLLPSNPSADSDADAAAAASPPEASSLISPPAIPATGDSLDCSAQSESSTTNQRGAEIQSQLMARREECRELFHLSPDNVLVQDYNCALQENILIQGHMYLFVHHICFYSNIFGLETKKIIPFAEITSVRRAKTAMIFPNAIEIVAREKKYFFTSFFFRDEAYRLIVDGWSQHNTSAQAVIDRQESKSDTGSQESVIVLFERLKNFTRSTSNMSSADRDSAAVPEEIKPSSNNEDNVSVSMGPSELHEGGGDENAGNSSCKEPLPWKVEDVDAPEIPEYYTTVAESKFPIRVEEFFNLFFSDDAFEFAETFHRRSRDKEFRCTKWNENEQFGYVRDVTFQHPIKLYFGARFGHCREVQKFRVYRNSHLIIETSQEISDVPYGDRFRVEGLWDVKEDGNEAAGCILRVHVNVAFSKKTMFKGKIEQSTIEECREACAVWISSANELLKRQAIVKPEGVGNDAINTTQNDFSAFEDSGEHGGPSETTRALDRVPQSLLDVMPLTAALSSIPSMLRESWASSLLYLKNQSHFPIMVFIAFASVIILMQVSIVVLLTRAPEVHLISQQNFVDSLATDRTEAVAWLERRVYQLRDEILMVETQMEKMHHEYVILKRNLQSLDKFKTRS